MNIESVFRELDELFVVDGNYLKIDRDIYNRVKHSWLNIENYRKQQIKQIKELINSPEQNWNKLKTLSKLIR